MGRRKKVGPGVFLASQLTEISGRYLAHVQDIREFLLKEKLPVPSPDAIPQLLGRLGTDSRFRADVGSLMRATLYQEREGIGYEDLLGILVAAAAGTEHDLKSDSQEADLRELLRFLLQSRRSTFPPKPKPEEARVTVEPDAQESVPVRPVRVNSEPVLHSDLRFEGRGTRSATRSMKLKLRSDEAAVAVAEVDGREADDVVLPQFLTSGLFAAQIESEAPQWRGRSVWIVAMICIALGLGVGAVFHRVVFAAGTHIAQTQVVRRAVDTFSSKQKTVGSVAPAVAPQESAAETSNVASSQNGSPATPQQPDRKADAEASSGVPVTVVKQEVTAWPGEPLDSRGPRSGAPSSAKTRSIVHQGSAGMTAANVIFSPAPAYPAEASAARVEGQVTVQAVVNPEGKVVSARAVSGPPQLRDAATEAVQRWRYSPLLENGKPVAVTTVAILDFKVAE